MPYNMPSPQPAQSGTPYYNDDQWADYMKLADLTGQEQQIAQQQALAKQLRGGGNQRMDWASQAARGLGGIGGAMGDVAAMKGMQDLSADRKTWLGTMANRRNALVPEMVPGQFSTADPKYG